jgi:addiction module RelE/StbE family toxin
LNKLVLSPHFKRAYKKAVRKYPHLQNQIDLSIQLLEENIYDVKLKTHKLSGELFGCYACVCGYDCRIIFTVEEKDNEKVVILVSIGTHNEVY